MNETIRSVDLADLWALLTDPKVEGWDPATVYEWTEEGVAIGVQGIALGNGAYLIVSDIDGYEVVLAREVNKEDLVPADEYDEDRAIRAASDLEGWFGIVGIPGSQYHDFEWFPEDDRDAAFEYVQRGFKDTLATNPVLGTIETEVVSASEAFDRTYRDGSRVYFRPKEVGTGFEPKQ